MNRKKLFTCLSLITALGLTLGCAASGQTAAESLSASGETLQAAETAAVYTVASGAVLSKEYKTADTDADYDASTAVSIDLYELTGSVYEITEGGTYLLTGSYAGQIRVEASEDEKVRLVLAGAAISCPDGPALYVISTDKLILTLADQTENSLSDGTDYQRDEEGADGAVYSKSDVSINGTGSLTVNGNTAHGIVSKDDLVITGGTITVNAVKDGLRGKDCVAVSGGTITVVAGSDGIQSGGTGEDEGCIVIDGGTVTVTAANDGIQAENSLTVNGGVLDITCGGGSATVTLQSDATGFGGGFWNQSAASETDTESSKGLKAGGDLIIQQGTVTLDTADDGIHAGGTVCIEDGTFQISSGDDAIHSDADVIIGGGTFQIPYCYEGIEGLTVTVSGGTVNIVSSDDGINAAGGADGSGFGGRGDEFSAQTGVAVVINGGDITIVSDGDSIDSNGDLTINGGTLKLTCNGNGNTALDANGTYTNNGGSVTTNDGSENGGGGMMMGGKRRGG